MTDHSRGRARRDDSLIPLLTALVVVAAFGPAIFTAVTQWLVPRLTYGRDAVALSFGDWFARNWWLVGFWVLELAVLVAFLTWTRRRRQRRSRQLESVVTGLRRVLPADWEPERHLRVLRWHGHRPVRVRIELTPRSLLDDPGWRRSLTEAAARVLGPLHPIAWPQPPSRSGVFDWGARPPRLELRVGREPHAKAPESMSAGESKVSANSGIVSPVPEPTDAEPRFYRRPRPRAPERVAADSGPVPARLERED